MDVDLLPPHKETPFLDLTSLAEATDHIDYDTSEDEADDEGDERKLNRGPGGEPDAGRAAAEKSCLSPLQRARFTRLLARMPTTIAKLRQGDITRVSNYVVNHAGGGAEEFVDRGLARPPDRQRPVVVGEPLPEPQRRRRVGPPEVERLQLRRA